MPARGDQGDERRLQVGVRKVRGGDVAFQVVYGDQREPAGVGKSFRGRDTNEERPDQTRLYRYGDAANLIESDLSVRQRLLHNPIQAFEMGAGGDLGNHAAVARVLRLRVDHVREGLAAVGLDDRSAGVITRRFDGQNHGSFIALRRAIEL
jgi:hypothetical protein